MAEVLVPGFGPHLNGPRHRHRLGELEHGPQDAALLVAITRTTEGVPHRVVHEERPWGEDLLGEVETRREEHRRDARLLDDPRDQTDRLVVERSSGDEEREVDLVTAELGGERRCRHLEHVLALVDPAHEAAPLASGDRTDDPLRSELP